MVVIEDLPQISVNIHITGSRDACIEYDDPEPPTTSSMDGTAQHSIFKIIESTDDAEFYIQYAIENNSDWFDSKKGIAVTCYIDGKRVASPLHDGKKALRNSITHKVNGVKLPSSGPGKATLRKFKFSTIQRGK